MPARSALPDSTTRSLSQELVELRRDVERLKRGNRYSQLGNSSLENTNIPIYDGDGTQRGAVGIQSDGTMGLTAQNGPPPPKLDTPILTPIASGINVNWNGSFSGGVRPGDFKYAAIHRGTNASIETTWGPGNLVGYLTEPGDYPDVPLDSGTKYFYVLVA